MKEDPIKIKDLLAQVHSGLRDIYGQRLRGMYLFGSHARGTSDKESDVDILVVLRSLEEYANEIRKTSKLISTISLQYSVSISRVFISEKHWVDGGTPFIANVQAEAIPA